MQQDHERLEQVDSPPVTMNRKNFIPLQTQRIPGSTELDYHLQTVVLLQASVYSQLPAGWQPAWPPSLSPSHTQVSFSTLAIPLTLRQRCLIRAREQHKPCSCQVIRMSKAKLFFYLTRSWWLGNTPLFLGTCRLPSLGAPGGDWPDSCNLDSWGWIPWGSAGRLITGAVMGVGGVNFSGNCQQKERKGKKIN